MISIMLYALINSRAEAEAESSRPFFPFVSRFHFRYVFAGLVIIALTTLSTSPLPTAHYLNMKMLKNLESYELKTTENPFLLQIGVMDPSLGIAYRIEENPFEKWINFQFIDSQPKTLTATYALSIPWSLPWPTK